MFRCQFGWTASQQTFVEKTYKPSYKSGVKVSILVEFVSNMSKRGGELILEPKHILVGPILTK